MTTTAVQLMESILYRDQQHTLGLLEEATKEWVEQAQVRQLNGAKVSSLVQMTLLGCRCPELMRELWEWTKAEELAGRLPDRQQTAEVLRETFKNWLQLLKVIQRATRASEAAGYPVRGADELDSAARELRAIFEEVDRTWPPQEPITSAPLSYEQLRSLAKRFPPPASWYEEEDPF
jgi:hypothetical protein